MNRNNEEEQKKILKEYEDFLLSFQDLSGTFMYEGPRKTGFLGFVLSMRSFVRLNEGLVLRDNAVMKYLMGYKFFQVQF